ncbi:pyruvate kinase [Legionella oakridgensis]|uniref:Pyruvate kinase n=2 Tax=Legionella oakridgensis TaxID=29423 RepID=W0B7E2_9GAMM|nr:pyruvate kinase [Legionella oakridgensis]AHE65755.1 pyruvate kinase [Legionella oakridgensis ATCC 33761 = DSM 21215]KTD38172.1 pyruvate kinase II [Legionella oakridgensis]STY15698.1 pyruvate kinase [Legionella longbeachae]
MQRRRTKIVATIGPASHAPEILRAMLLAGVDVLRINFSHATKEFAQTIKLARTLAAELHRPLAIMADLQGPKIRIGRFKNNTIILVEKQTFTLSCASDAKLGDETGVSVAYPNLCNELTVNDHLLLDDGLIELMVTAIRAPYIDCIVIEGGVLSNNKGINRKGGGLAAGALTDKDKEDMAAAIAAKVDYITLSFVKDANDIRTARQILTNLGASQIPIIAKIERTEALGCLTDIILEADAVMVARGDLGVEIGAAEVPAIQKRIIEQTRQLNKIVITATQMMESMITHPQPTRAEVSDVANAILDGTDAVMLSAETASGQYPVKVIQMVDKICLSAEKHAAFFYQTESDSCRYPRADQAIAMATMHVANHFPIKAIVALTESGATAIWMSRHYSTVPIYAISDNEDTVRKLSLVNNVFPLFYDYREIASKNINQQIITYLLKKNLVEENTFLLLTRGNVIGKPGGTNCMEIIRAK